MIKVSVVIPVYNVEKYLKDCLDSIVNQSLQDIEIICINDGSKDDSLKILNEYAKRDNRITVISQENKGHAVATNKGISLSKGKYLFLMDSDDILELNALEDTYNIAEEKKVDFVLFKAINYDDQNKKYYETEVYSMNQIYDLVGDSIFNYKDLDELIFKISVTPWSKIYNRKFIQENNINFSEGLIFDDNIFFWKVLFNANRIYFYNEFLFIRRWYATSSTKKGDKRFIDSIKIINEMFNVFKEFNLFDKYKKILYNKKISVSYMRFLNIADEFKELYFIEMKNEFINLTNDYKSYTEFMEVTNFNNKKIFESVLIAENSEEFSLYQEIFEVQIENYELKIKNKYLDNEKIKLNNIKNNILNSNSWKIGTFLSKFI